MRHFSESCMSCKFVSLQTVQSYQHPLSNNVYKLCCLTIWGGPTWPLAPNHDLGIQQSLQQGDDRNSIWAVWIGWCELWCFAGACQLQAGWWLYIVSCIIVHCIYHVIDMCYFMCSRYPFLFSTSVHLCYPSLSRLLGCSAHEGLAEIYFGVQDDMLERGNHLLRYAMCGQSHVVAAHNACDKQTHQSKTGVFNEGSFHFE